MKLSFNNDHFKVSCKTETEIEQSPIADTTNNPRIKIFIPCTNIYDTIEDCFIYARRLEVEKYSAECLNASFS
jgi:hypothetical protein